MSKKTLIILLVVIGLIYSVGVVAGATRADDPHDPDGEPPGIAAALESMLGSLAPGLDLGQIEVRGGTLDVAKRSLTIPKASPSCTLTIKASKDGVRIVRIELLVPPVVQVTSFEPKQDKPKARELQASSPLSLAFREQGGVIVITHGGETQCKLRFPE